MYEICSCRDTVYCGVFLGGDGGDVPEEHVKDVEIHIDDDLNPADNSVHE